MDSEEIRATSASLGPEQKSKVLKGLAYLVVFIRLCKYTLKHFVFFFKGEQDTVTLFCCESAVGLLMEGLEKTRLIDWTKPFFFLHLPIYMAEGIRALVDRRADGQGDFQFVNTFLYSKEDDEEDLV